MLARARADNVFRRGGKRTVFADLVTKATQAGAVAIAAQGTPDELRAVLAGVPGAAWGMKREHLSPRATTRWAEIPSASVSPGME